MTKSQHTKYVAEGGPAADQLASWMINMGVRVVGHVVSFANRKGFALEKASGAQWARLDLFKMAKHMQPEFVKRGLMTSHVLYTDMDIFFSHDLPMPGTGTLRSCGQPYRDPKKVKVRSFKYSWSLTFSVVLTITAAKQEKGDSWSNCIKGTHEKGRVVTDPNFPYIFGAATEVFTPWGMNSGVMYINVENATKYADALIDFAAARGYKSFSTADQSCMERFFSQENFGPRGENSWDWLDDAVINSRGFLQPAKFLDHSGTKRAGKGVSTASGEVSSRAAVWHWHGYKADQIRCFFDRIVDGSWDVTKSTEQGPTEADVPGCHIVKGSGAFPHAMKGCYLVTYAWMLTQHERLQQIARSMQIKQEGEW
jgi:hypothetical protein